MAATKVPAVRVHEKVPAVDVPKLIVPVPFVPAFKVPAVSVRVEPLIIDRPVGMVTVPPENVLFMVTEGN